MAATFDWLTIWQSVDKDGADPTASWRAELAVQQEASRSKSPIEVWLENYRPEDGDCRFRRLPDGGFEVSAMNAFDEFDTYRTLYWPNYTKISVTSFGRQMGNLADAFGVTKRMDKRGTLYIWPQARD